MGILKFILTESRQETLKKKYSDKFNDQLLDLFLNFPFLKQTNHKYTDFFLKVLDPESRTIDQDIETLIDNLSDFHKFQSSIEKKDINQYKTLEELQYALIEPKTKAQEKKLESEAEKVYEDDEFLVVIPKTQEASCKYGANTKWCVTQKNRGHFETYTRGAQVLYFIINKKSPKDDDSSKIAVHFDSDGVTTYYDAKDKVLTDRQMHSLEEMYPEVFDAIKNNYSSKFSTRMKRFLLSVFKIEEEVGFEEKNFKDTGYDVEVNSGNLQIVSRFGEAEGISRLWVKKDDEYKNNFEFNFAVNFEEADVDSFSFSVHFFTPKNMRIRIPDFAGKIKYRETPELTNLVFLNAVNEFFFDQIENFEGIEKYIKEKYWIPNKFYGYTFQQNKGLIKKLVDWLDSGSEGTKLDFLTDISKLERKVVDGKKMYRIAGDEKFRPVSDLRGHFSSFFVSAKDAGIIDYNKVGKKYFIVKGPNFDTFVRGELKAV